MFVGFKKPRLENKAHLDFVRGLPCAVCGNNIQTEAAHLRAGDLLYGKRNTGRGEKPSDIWVLPLCGEHHREQHDQNESEFWRRHGINPFVLALSLTACSGDQETAETVIQMNRS